MKDQAVSVSSHPPLLGGPSGPGGLARYASRLIKSYSSGLSVRAWRERIPAVLFLCDPRATWGPQRRACRSDTSNHGAAPPSGPAHGARVRAEAEPGAKGRGSEEALGAGAWARPAAGCGGPAETEGPEEL